MRTGNIFSIRVLCMFACVYVCARIYLFSDAKLFIRTQSSPDQWISILQFSHFNSRSSLFFFSCSHRLNFMDLKLNVFLGFFCRKRERSKWRKKLINILWFQNIFAKSSNGEWIIWWDRLAYRWYKFMKKKCYAFYYYVQYAIHKMAFYFTSYTYM